MSSTFPPNNPSTITAILVSNYVAGRSRETLWIESNRRETRSTVSEARKRFLRVRSRPDLLRREDAQNAIREAHEEKKAEKEDARSDGATSDEWTSAQLIDSLRVFSASMHTLRLLVAARLKRVVTRAYRTEINAKRNTRTYPSPRCCSLPLCFSFSFASNLLSSHPRFNLFSYSSRSKLRLRKRAYYSPSSSICDLRAFLRFPV